MTYPVMTWVLLILVEWALGTFCGEYAWQPFAIGAAPLVIILGVAFCLREGPPPHGKPWPPSVWDGYPGILK